MYHTLERKYSGGEDNALGMTRLTHAMIGTRLFDEVEATDDLLSATNYVDKFTVLVDYKNADKEVVELKTMKSLKTIKAGDGKNTHNITIMAQNQIGIELGRVLDQIYKEFDFSEQK